MKGSVLLQGRKIIGACAEKFHNSDEQFKSCISQSKELNESIGNFKSRCESIDNKSNMKIEKMGECFKATNDKFRSTELRVNDVVDKCKRFDK